MGYDLNISDENIIKFFFNLLINDFDKKNILNDKTVNKVFL